MVGSKNVEKSKRHLETEREVECWGWKHVSCKNYLKTWKDVRRKSQDPRRKLGFT